MEHGNRAHALLSASDSSRWLNCTPSAKLEDDLQLPRTSSTAADEGTLAHEIAEVLLKVEFGLMDSADAEDACRELEANPLYYPEMYEELKLYVDECRALTEEMLVEDGEKPIVIIEQRIDLTAYAPESFGSNDFVAITSKQIVVVDLKFGRGVPVYAKNNSQLRLYALGALKEIDFLHDAIKSVRTVVVQPRLDSISDEVLTAEELITWGEEYVKPRALKAFKGEGVQVVGDWCKFCKIKPTCKAMADEAAKVIATEFKPVSTIEVDEILYFKSKAKLVTDWLNSIEAYIHATMLNGQEWEGLKLVAGRSQRKITDADAVLTVLNDTEHDYDVYSKRSLLGIGALEKALSKEEFKAYVEPYIVKPEGTPTVVSINDARPAIKINKVEEDFAAPMDDETEI